MNDLGLNDNESAVYLAMLPLGPATILGISKASGVKRTTIYNVLEGLNRKGLTRVDIRGFKKLYVAEHPQKLERMLEHRQTDLKQAFPEFEALYNLKGGESFIKYYEGSESVKNAYFDMLAALQHNDMFLVIGDPDKWERVNASFGTDFIKTRNKQKLQIRMFLVDSDTSRQYKTFEKDFHEQIKLLPKNSPMETNLVVTPRMVLIQQMVAPFVLVTIENKSIIHLHKELFDIMWKSL